MTQSTQFSEIVQNLSEEDIEQGYAKVLVLLSAKLRDLSLRVLLGKTIPEGVALQNFRLAHTLHGLQLDLVTKKDNFNHKSFWDGIEDAKLKQTLEYAFFSKSNINTLEAKVLLFSKSTQELLEETTYSRLLDRVELLAYLDKHGEGVGLHSAYLDKLVKNYYDEQGVELIIVREEI